MKKWYVIYYYYVDGNCNPSQEIHRFLHSTSEEDELIQNLVKCVYDHRGSNADCLRLRNVLQLNDDGTKEEILQGPIGSKINHAFNECWKKFNN